MNHAKTDEKHQPRAPVPGIHTPVHLQTSHIECYGFFQGGPAKFLPEGTQNLPSMAMTSTQAPQPLSSACQYYGESLNCTQHYCMLQLPGGPVGFLPVWTQNPPAMAATSAQASQRPPRTPEHNGEASGGPQKNDMPTLPGTAGDLTACQPRSPSSSLPRGVAGASAHSSNKPVEDALQKREHRLMKNREAARECRRKKKEYVKCLENRVAVLENQNKTLIEELRALKDIYRHKVEVAARASRKRRKIYMDHLQIRNTLLERENQMLKAWLHNPNSQTPCLDRPLTPLQLSP